jgi:hypothetical protein
MRKQQLLSRILIRRKLLNSVHLLFQRALRARCALNEQRAAAAAAAVKSQAASTIQGLIDTMERVQGEVDHYRREAFDAMSAAAEKECAAHLRMQQARDDGQQLFGLWFSPSDLNATAEFVKTKLCDVTVRALLDSYSCICNCDRANLIASSRPRCIHHATATATAFTSRTNAPPLQLFSQK